MKKTLLVIGIVATLLFTSSIVSYGANINVNGSDVTFTESTGYPYVDENNRTQVPLRITMEKAGATVSWNSDSKMAIIEKRGTVVQIPIGSQYIIVDGKQVSTDTAAVIKNGRTYLPIRAVLEAVDFSVDWDNNTQTVFAANYYDYLENEEIVLSDKRQNINNIEDLLDYLISEHSLEEEKDVASQLAEREYLDKFSNNTGVVKVTSYSEWYDEDQLEDAGVTLDDSGFSIDKDEDLNYIYSGKLLLTGNGKTVTINIPNHTVHLSYNDDSDQTDERTSTYNGVTIYFCFGELEFKGKDLYTLGLIN